MEKTREPDAREHNRKTAPLRALFSVTDKTGIAELAHAFVKAGIEIVATGGTAKALAEAGVAYTPIEAISGAVEAFQGRMKTLTFNVCSGILYRRDDAADARDAERLKIPRIDVVVCNFYAFSAAAAATGTAQSAQLTEKIDIGGPTLVRAAAKNSDHVLVLTDSTQYARAAEEASTGFTEEFRRRCAAQAWDHVLAYDSSIARVYGLAPRSTGAGLAPRSTGAGASTVKRLRYGENPHQSATLTIDADSPIDWSAAQARTELSYNNILDISAAYDLVSEIKAQFTSHTSVAIFKHFNPCGVAGVPRTTGASAGESALQALKRAWEGDPISAFGGVIVFSEPPGSECAEWLEGRFVDCVAYPSARVDDAFLGRMLAKRKNLKFVSITRFGGSPEDQSVRVPGGVLHQTTDRGISEHFRSVTKRAFDGALEGLARFGVLVCRALKSNAVCLVRADPQLPGAIQLIGTGQGQPNRVEAIERLAIPRARAVLEANGGGDFSCTILVSDAFFPFADAVEACAKAGVQTIVQPGGSVKDAEVIAAADRLGLAMAFTGVRHFRH